MKLVTIIGARPQFIKAAAVSRAIDAHNLQHDNPQMTEIMVHTGQHYDHNMSQVFFEEFKMSKPHYNLEVGSGRHGEMTGNMLSKIEEVLLQEKPDLALVYGDTNSTIAGALAAVKLHIPVAHVEAGLRSFNRQMPEETNRVLTDHIATFLFCPTSTAVKNLKLEGITKGVFQTGDVMYDAFLFSKALALGKSKILEELGLSAKNYCLATIHREENTDNAEVLLKIFNTLSEISAKDRPVIVPLHPRTHKALKQLEEKIHLNSHLCLIPPVSYLDMVVLEDQAKIILTDSGGIQKESYFAGVPCLTLRNETEWIETVENGANFLVGSDMLTTIEAFEKALSIDLRLKKGIYGTGRAADKIVESLVSVC